MTSPRSPFDPEGYYARLGVDPGAGAQTISAAYRRKARVLHPDIPGTGNADAFVALKQAYDVLIQPVRRAAYDRLARQSAAPQQPPGEIQPTPYPDMPAPPTRHPRLHDLPIAVWAGMAVLLALGIVEVGLHLLSQPGQTRRETIPANARAVPAPAPGEVASSDYGPAPVPLVGTPNFYVLPMANPATLWRVDPDRHILVPWRELPPFSAVQGIRLLKQNGMIEVRVTDSANGYIDAGRLTPGDQVAATRARCTFHAGPTPENGEVLTHGPEGRSSLSIDNRSGQPAVVKIRSADGATIASVFLGPDGEATIRKLPEDPVRLDFATGEIWSRACHGFAAAMRARRLPGLVTIGAMGQLAIPPDSGVATVELSDQAFQQE
jgi:hypothetical protein